MLPIRDWTLTLGDLWLWGFLYRLPVLNTLLFNNTGSGSIFKWKLLGWNFLSAHKYREENSNDPHSHQAELSTINMWAYLFPAFSFNAPFLKPTRWNYVLKNMMCVSVCVHTVNSHIHTCSHICGFLLALSWSFRVGRCCVINCYGNNGIMKPWLHMSVYRMHWPKNTFLNIKTVSHLCTQEKILTLPFWPTVLRFFFPDTTGMASSLWMFPEIVLAYANMYFLFSYTDGSILLYTVWYLSTGFWKFWKCFLAVSFLFF